jgi:hypothetical protein
LSLTTGMSCLPLRDRREASDIDMNVA